MRRFRWIVVIASLICIVYYICTHGNQPQEQKLIIDPSLPGPSTTIGISSPSIPRITTIPPYLLERLRLYAERSKSTSRTVPTILPVTTEAEIITSRAHPTSPSPPPSPSPDVSAVSCISNSSSLAPIQYNPPNDPLMAGRLFQVSDLCWKQYGLPPKSFTNLDSRGKFLDEFVFVTGCSTNHFKESLDAIATVQAHWPERKIIYFDLGLTTHQVAMLTGQGPNRTKMCDVEYRVFNFSKYPPHVAQILTFSWKILIIKEILQEYPGLFWMDASVRFKKNDLKGYTSRLTDSKGFVFFSGSATSIYAVTAPKMYEYLPMDIDDGKKVTMWEANSMLIFNTEPVYENVLKWAYACALLESCIAPTRNRTCILGKESRLLEYHNCHRYDQSIFNILLANWWHFYDGHYTVPGFAGILEVHRAVTYFHEVKYCPVGRGD